MIQPFILYFLFFAGLNVVVHIKGLQRLNLLLLWSSEEVCASVYTFSRIADILENYLKYKSSSI